VHHIRPFILSEVERLSLTISVSSSILFFSSRNIMIIFAGFLSFDATYNIYKLATNGFISELFGY